MIGLAVAPEVLLWDERSAALRETVEAEYGVLLNEAFLHLWSKDGTGSAGLEEVQGLVRDTPADALARLLRAPRSSRRLLWPRAGEAARTRRFLRAALLAERQVLGLNGGPLSAGWTADCRAYIRSNGSVVAQPTLSNGLIPLDLRSPHARSLDLMGGSRIVRDVRSTPSTETATRTVERLEAAWRGILAAGGTTAGCVAAWTRVIVPQSSPSGLFWSGSNGEYVGRVVLVNIAEERVSIEEIVDALVHEAIHGFLYMHESLEPWVLDLSLYTDEGAIVSPWSGTLLPVRPFMQACFVWYGLTMFWAQHVGSGAFDQERTYYLLGRALAGFRGDSLADLLAPSRDAIRPELVDLIDELQQTVRSLLG
jgi:hypothetical protein